MLQSVRCAFMAGALTDIPSLEVTTKPELKLTPNMNPNLAGPDEVV